MNCSSKPVPLPKKQRRIAGRLLTCTAYVPPKLAVRCKL